MARVGGPQKGQIAGGGMASVMVHGKQVMVQGGAMIQGQATFIPSQTPLIPGLQTGQTAIIQGGSIFVQGQPGQNQGQTVMIQGRSIFFSYYYFFNYIKLITSLLINIILTKF